MANREGVIALRGGIEVVEAVLGDLAVDGIEGLLDDLVAWVGRSGQNPDVLNVVNMRQTGASIDDGVVVVIGLDDLVVASRDQRTELDLEIAFILGWVNDGGPADGTVLPVTKICAVLVVEDVDAAVGIKGVSGEIADTGAWGGLKSALFVAAGLIPRAKVLAQIEILLDLRFLASASVMSLHEGSGGNSGNERLEHESKEIDSYMKKFL